MSDPLIAYCGPAAVPDDLWVRWNFDPLLIAALAALALAVARGRSSNAGAGLWRNRADGPRLRLPALRAVIGAVLGAGIPSCHSGRRRRAVAGVGVSAATCGLAAALAARRRACGHPLALARAGPLWLGSRHGAGLLADAGFAAGERLAHVAGDPGAAGRARPGARRAGGDGRADGSSRRTDRLRIPAALRGAFQRAHCPGDSLRSPTSNSPGC